MPGVAIKQRHCEHSSEETCTVGSEREEIDLEASPIKHDCILLSVAQSLGFIERDRVALLCRLADCHENRSILIFFVKLKKKTRTKCFHLLKEVYDDNVTSRTRVSE
jgi:hypothetical protein